MRLAAFSSLALLAGLTTPTYAFDDLLKAIGLMPGAIEQPKAFDYLAPSLGFLNGNQNTYGVIDDLPLVVALAEGQQDEVTGIDFSKATAVLSLGAAPEQTTVIFGETGFADGAHDALLARGFSDNEDGEITIYANGEDGAMDLTAANAPDPLGSGMGKAQRLAVASDYVLRTDNWPLMNQSLTVLHMKPGYTDMWADTIRGIQQVSEDGAQLELASGWTLWAFANADPMTMSPDQPKSGGKTKTEQAGFDPLGTFPVAVIGLTRGQQTAGLHIAIPFGNPDHAKQTGETIVEKLADFPVETPDASFTVVPAGDQPGSYSVLVVTMQNYESDIAELEDLYTGFNGAIYRREFTPLMTGL